jgi:hypothetical protein
VENVENFLKPLLGEAYSHYTLWKTCGKTYPLFHRVFIPKNCFPQDIGPFPQAFHRFSTELSTGDDLREKFSTGFPQDF